jgi:transcriptional regulator with XRE-family HTH domain
MAGVTQRQVSEATGIPQPTVVRIERGESSPSWPQVQAWAARTEAAGPDLAALREMTEAALARMTPIAVRLAAGLEDSQNQVADLEATAAVQRTFNPWFIPGLLQTAPYAQQVLGVFHLDTAAAVAARMRRQQILYEPERKFEFLVTEAALGWHAGDTSVLPGQLDHIASVAGLAAVEFGIIPNGAAWHALPMVGFVLYEERAGGEAPLAVVETPATTYETSGEADIDSFREHLAALRESAVYGDDAIALVRGLIRENR